MSTGAEFKEQNAEQPSNETFTGKPMNYRKAAEFEPPYDAENRKPSTKNDNG